MSVLQELQKSYKIRLNTKRKLFTIRLNKGRLQKSGSECAAERALKNPADPWHTDFA